MEYCTCTCKTIRDHWWSTARHSALSCINKSHSSEVAYCNLIQCRAGVHILVKCQHEWLRRLDSDADFIRIFSFDFTKAFDSVPHDIVCRKLRNFEINPYILNWIVNFLKGRQQRVVVDGISTSYLSINRGTPQGTVIGPILFSIMINDIKAVNPSGNLLVKYADDISLSIPVGAKLSQADSEIEVKSIME